MSIIEPEGEENLLLIFTKNQKYGKVKTRLAKSIGHDKAMKVYRHLLEHTKNIALKINCQRMVSYSDYVDFNDVFDNSKFIKDDQAHGDLGQRMAVAFEECFDEGYQKVVCIGSDCIEITDKLIQEAFNKLNDFEIILGPAMDGGYYLLGMREMNDSLFINKPWSGNNLLLDTILDLKNQGLSYYLLDTLSDVDRVEDLNEELKDLIKK